jgi:methylated-DNA-protein-cysteine methyltransferase related protein
MAGSAAFVRIKSEVFSTVRAIPPGRVTTLAAIGERWDVMPRHVAYLLATLTDDERATLPWHRVVRESGELPSSKNARPEEQKMLLESEGVRFSDKTTVAELESILYLPQKEVT